MEVKNKKTNVHYEFDFKEEILRMLNSGRNVDNTKDVWGWSK